MVGKKQTKREMTLISVKNRRVLTEELVSGHTDGKVASSNTSHQTL